MKNILYFFLLISLPNLLQAQQDTLLLRREGGNDARLFPGSYGTRGKSMTGTAGIYNAGMEKKAAKDADTVGLPIYKAVSNKFPINSLVIITNPANHRNILARIKEELGVRAKKRGDLADMDKPGISALKFGKKTSYQIKIQLVVLSDSLSLLNTVTDTIVIRLDTLKKEDASVPNTFKVIGKPVKGIASFYSANLDGTKTATGEIFRHKKLTAASNNFKLNTWVLVTNLKNQKSVVVRINDRMHPRMKKKGRVVDLSRSAAALLDFMEDGLAKVKVEPVQFVYAVPKSDLDTVRAMLQNDSLRVSDSLKLDSAKTKENVLLGIASFYSTNLDGTKTATGETYRNNKLTAASNDLKLNTWVKVTNLKNNKYVILRINDRMHPRMQKKGRVLDLSRAAARKLDFIKSGLAQVRVEVVPKATLE